MAGPLKCHRIQGLEGKGWFGFGCVGDLILGTFFFFVAFFRVFVVVVGGVQPLPARRNLKAIVSGYLKDSL